MATDLEREVAPDAGTSRLDWQGTAGAGHLLALPVSAFLAGWPSAELVSVAEIDPELADTAAFCQA